MVNGNDRTACGGPVSKHVPPSADGWSAAYMLSARYAATSRLLSCRRAKARRQAILGSANRSAFVCPGIRSRAFASSASSVSASWRTSHVTTAHASLPDPELGRCPRSGLMGRVSEPIDPIRLTRSHRGATDFCRADRARPKRSPAMSACFWFKSPRCCRGGCRYDGSGLLRRDAGGRFWLVTAGRTSSIPIKARSFTGAAFTGVSRRQQNCYQHGRQRGLARQRIRRAPMAPASNMRRCI